MEMEQMLARRIEKIEDVMMLYNGILDGIHLGSFTDNSMLTILDLIVQKNTTYFIFEDANETVGFGGIKDDVEIFKVYVMPNYRRRKYGKRISLFLTKKIFDYGKIPVCWIKKENEWNNAMKELGMDLMKEQSFDVNKYRLRDLEVYVNAQKKYEVEKIEEKKYERRRESWKEYRRHSRILEGN